ncbi:MAG: PTS sugar transporter subunit IIA [Aquiluna sp.]|nr:PTS sugar transporter subunit IIA [Aquiluna sp.]
MKSSYFAPGSIAIQENCPSFQVAVTSATLLLVETGSAHKGYVSEVQNVLEELGPYFVVAPGLAIAHAKLSAAIQRPAMALLKLTEPVTSGSHNDPVSLVFAMCSPDSISHLEMLAEFGELMSRDGIINNLLNASAEGVIREILSSHLIE